MSGKGEYEEGHFAFVSHFFGDAKVEEVFEPATFFGLVENGEEVDFVRFYEVFDGLFGIGRGDAVGGVLYAELLEVLLEGSVHVGVNFFVGGDMDEVEFHIEFLGEEEHGLEDGDIFESGGIDSECEARDFSAFELSGDCEDGEGCIFEEFDGGRAEQPAAEAGGALSAHDDEISGDGFGGLEEDIYDEALSDGASEHNAGAKAVFDASDECVHFFFAVFLDDFVEVGEVACASAGVNGVDEVDSCACGIGYNNSVAEGVFGVVGEVCGH